MNKRILIVEDEKKLSQVMKLYLEKEGYDITLAFDGEEGEDALYQDFDLIILDVMMPKKDGWSLLRKIKKETNTPVILTTARGEEDDRIFGLELGAEDYMVKPISMKELVLRVKLRIKSLNDNKPLILDNMIIEEKRRTVIEDNIEIPLTPKEFDLVFHFSNNPNIVFTRLQLLQNVWDINFEGDGRTVDTHVKNLREKISYFNTHLKTVWGVGYKLE
ncbi:MAG: response regulator transcription factor [Clostridium sp.]|uniref:response regulator transcription factor n=1 Tax=Clostridium sp. TaxID=1506 RepID=UPI00303D7BB2